MEQSQVRAPQEALQAAQTALAAGAAREKEAEDKRKKLETLVGTLQGALGAEKRGRARAEENLREVRAQLAASRQGV